MSDDRFEIVPPEDAPERVRQTFVKGQDLDHSYVGKFLGGNDGHYNRQGKILQLVPVITDPQGSWLVTVRWGETPTTPASTQQVRIPFHADVEFIEFLAA